MARRSPPMPVMLGSTTVRTAAAVTAASTALPPSHNTRRPAAEASAWLVAIMPRRPIATERVPWILPAGRSPDGGECGWFRTRDTRPAPEGVDYRRRATVERDATLGRP